MKTKTNYSKPMFFGWYVIGSKPQENRQKALGSNGAEHRTLNQLYTK